MNEGNSSMAN